jgi:hypothetical protein
MNTLAPTISALSAALVLASLIAASPRAQAQTIPTVGQNATTNSQLTTANTANALGRTTSGQQPRPGVTTGVICIQEMTATFCNVVGGPNTNGYGSEGSVSRGASGSGSGSGSASASASASGGAGANTSSIPTCGGFPSANELCN